ncbi:MAG: hypothetical protein LWW95_10075 [Candidatus Desulfofervidus auxilii]|nr:hypothetical protein [Candidatus Desulfofervidus auxilii]
MKTYTKEQLFREIYLNEDAKFTSTKWEEDNFIMQKDGQIIDHEGNPFNLMTAEDEEWIVWVEPKRTQNPHTITKEEALKALYSGERVKALEWDNKSLELKDGQILLNDKAPFNIMTAKEKDWVIIKECKDTQNESQQIAELKAMLEEVLAKNSTKEAKHTDGRSTEEQAKTTELIKEVYGVSTPKEVQEQFREKLENAHSTLDVEKAVCEYIPYCWMGNRTLGTTSVYYSNMRKVIKGLKNEEHREIGLNLFVAPQSVYETVQAKITDNKKEEIRNKNTFEKKYIEDLMKKIKDKILSDDFSDHPRQTDEEREKAYWAYAYLTIVTGRRQSEILKTLKIKKKNNVWQYCGIIKDREEDKCIDAYSLDEDYEFLSDLVDYIQSHLESDKFTKREMNSKFNNSFNNALKRITGTSFKASDYRDIYAELLWLKEKDKKGSQIDKRDFKAKVLGHKYDGKLSATEHYDSWEAI